MTPEREADHRARLVHERSDADLVIRLEGSWVASPLTELPPDLVAEIERGGLDTIRVEGRGVDDWDSRALIILQEIERRAVEHDASVDRDALPDGLQRLWTLLDEAPEARETPGSDQEGNLLERFGLFAIEFGVEAHGLLAFAGEMTLAFGRFVRGRPGFRRTDLFMEVQKASVEALPIVSLIGFILGVILAFVSAIQLEEFGATSYVADLVGISMVRDMGALMTAIVMAGRSGAAFAAALASMKLNEEIDALVTMGIRPLGFLALPRVLALSAMLPALSLFATVGGVLGGWFISFLMLDATTVEYYQRTVDAVVLTDVLGGLFKAFVYGALVALAGCFRGMQATRSAIGVGSAATSAAVTGILWVIIASGAFAWVFWVLGI
jgi:phospholipid/cholesterol/gamma-HCH transport system permease protein